VTGLVWRHRSADNPLSYRVGCINKATWHGFRPWFGGNLLSDCKHLTAQIENSRTNAANHRHQVDRRREEMRFESSRSLHPLYPGEQLSR